MDAQLKRGLLDACVLTVLNRGESYGYQLARDVGEIIEVSESTLYPILRRLEAGGLVTVRSAEHNGRLRRYYRISDAGRRRLLESVAQWRDLTRALNMIEREVCEHDKGNISESIE